MPIELEMLGIPNKTMLRSTTKYALADVTIDFQDGVDIYWARNQVAERLAGAVKDMPSSTAAGLAPITTPLAKCSCSRSRAAACRSRSVARCSIG